MRHLQLRAAHLLNQLHHTRYDALCEALGGFRNQVWQDLVYGHGEPSTGVYGLVRRTHYDCDYHNYVLTQVWDHSAENPRWEFILLHNTGANEWVPEQVWSWGDQCPSEAEAGQIVDELEELRHVAWRETMER